MNKQKEEFIRVEADAWFDRNLGNLEKYDAKEDGLISLIQKYNLNPKNILEIGCSGGYRLNALGKLFPDVNLFGVEPSTKAINYGQKNYPKVNFINSTVDNLSVLENNKFDLIILGFMFYVVDRELIFKAMSEIDSKLKNKGMLLMIDFYAIRPLKKNYTHINSFEAYTFKQKYDDLFSQTGLYHLVHKETIMADKSRIDLNDNFDNFCSISLLKKDIDAIY